MTLLMYSMPYMTVWDMSRIYMRYSALHHVIPKAKKEFQDGTNGHENPNGSPCRMGDRPPPPLKNENPEKACG